LITGEILTEYGEVLGRLHVKPALSRTIIKLLREEAELVSRIKTIAAHPDPDDAPFWECAESGDADFIVTLNPKDFPQARLRAKVIAPGDPLPTIRHKPKIKRRPLKRPRRPFK
jgi:predicted nucleic acid-binding protein